MLKDPKVVQNILGDFMASVSLILKDPKSPTRTADLYARSFPFRVKLCNNGFTMTEAEKMCREETEKERVPA